MLELYSFVDYFTIPPSFVSIYLDRTWIGKYKTSIFDRKWQHSGSVYNAIIYQLKEEEKKFTTHTNMVNELVINASITISYSHK
jgi:hypothetical protein